MLSNTYYESQETILNRMLSKTSAKGLSVDEGSTSYIQQSPMAGELEKAKLDQDEIMNRSNIITAYENGYDEDVVKYAAEDGIDRKAEHEATGIETFIGVEGTTIPIGFKFGNKNNGLVYETVLEGTIDSTGSVDILSVSTEKAAKYNAKAGTLNYMPISMIGVTSCTNKEDFTKGRDIESIDDLFYRHQLKVRQNPNGCNRAQYLKWCTDVEGVGAAKVYPLTDETMSKKRGHVCCVITNSEKRAADEELCTKTKNYIDPGDGDGSGVAPCNAIVHVISADELVLNITANVEYESSTNLTTIKTSIEEAITTYLKKMSFNVSKISFTRIGSLFYTINGLVEYTNLKINGFEDDIAVGDNQIAVLGSVTINENS